MHLLAGMITQGIEHEKILERVREASTGSRTSFIEKKDLRNICAEYGLQGNEYRHSEDSISVRRMTQEMKESGEVVYFKDQDETDQNNPEIPAKESVLAIMKEGQEKIHCNKLISWGSLQVCMDSTHCISQYKGYQLTTLMTITDFNRGFPVAFLISSTVSTAIVKVFLASLKARVGLVQGFKPTHS